MKKFLFITAFSLFLNHVFAQQNRVLDRNNIGWYVYNGDHKLSDKWELHTEYQWRRIDFVRTWQQSLARLGLIRTLTDRLKVSGGYTFFTTYPYGDYPTADAGIPTPEHRLYEDIQLKDQVGRVGLAHRVRLEQRWLGQPSENTPQPGQTSQPITWEYQHRIRYQLSGTIPLNGPTIDDGELYANFFDELFISFGRNVGNNIYNQNRLSGGLGYQLRDNLKLELNYLYQITQHPEPDPITGNSVFEINNGFRLNVSYDLDFSKRKAAL